MNNKYIICLIISLLLIYFNSYAQIVNPHFSDIYVTTDTDYVKSSVLSKAGHINTHSDEDYYWYAYGKIIKTQGDFSGKLLNGTYTMYYLDNNLKEKGKFNKGIKEGLWNAWYNNGIIKEISHWRNGKKNGTYLLYDKKGELIYKASFKNNKLNGKVISYDKRGDATIEKYCNGVIVQPKTDNNNKTNLFQKIKGLFKKKKANTDN